MIFTSDIQDEIDKGHRELCDFSSTAVGSTITPFYFIEPERVKQCVCCGAGGQIKKCEYCGVKL